MVESPRVLVVEDDPTVQNLLVALLRTENYEVRAADDATSALRVSRTFRPDVAVLDVHLPSGPDGFSLARQIRERHGAVGIMFLTAADEAADLEAGFEAGADFYVTKPFSVDAFLVRVGVLLRRAGKSGRASLKVGDLAVDEDAHQVTRAGRPIDLSPLEFELLTRLVQRPGRVLSKTQLLAELWGYQGYSANVVERHMSSLRRKLEGEGPRLIHTVRGIGYVIRTER